MTRVYCDKCGAAAEPDTRIFRVTVKLLPDGDLREFEVCAECVEEVLVAVGDQE